MNENSCNIYKKNTNDDLHYGFIAQDLETSFPDLVKNNNSYKSINYIELIPIIVAKMKKMQSEIDELKSQISILTQHNT